MKLVSLFSALLLAASTTTTANAALVRRGAAPDADNVVKCVFMFHFNHGQDPEALVADHFKRLSIDYTVRVTSKTQLSNFVSVSLGDDCDIDAVESLASASHYNVVTLVQRPTPKAVLNSDAPISQEAIHGLTGVNQARDTLHLTGKGIKVAVIDTGVYYLHPALGGGMGPSFKVLGGWDFVGDTYDGTSASLKPDNDPLDNCSESSHGTHVSGIIAADARNMTQEGFVPSFPFTGVAPDARILGYRVFGCNGDAGNDIVTSAIYMAAEDGADIINMSLGGFPGYTDDPQVRAVDDVSNKGVIVISSAGNSGSTGVYSVGNPGNGLLGLSIASFDNAEAPFPYAIIDEKRIPYGFGEANANFKEGQLLDVVVNDLDADANDVQDDGVKINVNATGKALLLRWGDRALGGGSSARCGRAFAAGAAQCVLYSTDLSIPGIAGSADIPSIMIGQAGGRAIIAAVKAGKTPKFEITSKQLMAPLGTAGTISDFSSIGLGLDLAIKPELGGIGGQVFSTMSPHASAKNPSAYGLMSGTSMACPYVVGATALLLQQRKGLNFEQVRGYLQNAASPKVIVNEKKLNSVAVQGAGLVNAYWAAASKSLVLPSQIALNDTDNFVSSATLTLHNNDKVDVTYTFSTDNAATVNPYASGDDFTLDFARTEFSDDKHATVAFGAKSVTVPAGSTGKINVQFTAPISAEPSLFPIYSGYIAIVASNQPDYRMTVPFAGVIGSWKAQNIWLRNSASLVESWAQTEVVQEATGIPDGAVSTGLYDANFTAIVEGGILDVTKNAAKVVAINAFTTRSAKVQIVPSDAALKNVLAASGFNTSAPIIIQLSDLLAKNAVFPADWTPWNRPTYVDDGSGMLPPSVYGFSGKAINKDGDVAMLPSGKYQLKFTAIKNFAWGRDEMDFDTIVSAGFNLITGEVVVVPSASSVVTSAAGNGTVATATMSGDVSTATTGSAAASVSVIVVTSYVAPPPVSSQGKVAPSPSNIYKSSAVAAKVAAGVVAAFAFAL
ncbi:peptidase S8/S53 domain-containing protein [Chytriomyces cf. hyalinus JEL632]|nr:peptidase S8/S53 domain-containing protein [Chytriomyces cf. hyalinus JEL632]